MISWARETYKDYPNLPMDRYKVRSCTINEMQANTMRNRLWNNGHIV